MLWNLVRAIAFGFIVTMLIASILVVTKQQGFFFDNFAERIGIWAVVYLLARLLESRPGIFPH